MAAVGRQRPPWSINVTIPIMEESSPPVPFPPSLSPQPPHIVPKQRLFWADAAQRSIRRGGGERDGSDPDDDAPPDLTGEYRHSPVQINTNSYVEKQKHKPLAPSMHRD